MNLSKAIAILTYRLPFLEKHADPDMKDASKLAIEALKFTKDWQMGIYLEKADLLPGETED